MWPIEWKTVSTSLVILVLGGILGYLGRILIESRKRIRFITRDVYFGPALFWNLFMGRNYPSENAISFECEIKFFSERSQTVGLHDFRLQFCHKTLLGSVVDFEPDMQRVYRDMDKKDGPHLLGAIELQSRTFISFQLSTYIGREHWQKMQHCTFVRLRCKTAEGRIKHFTIDAICMPSMPPEGMDGTQYMSVQVTPTNYPQTSNPMSLVIMAARRREHEQTNLFTIAPEDLRYWDGTGWVKSKAEAKVYSNMDEAHSDGERVKIWNLVPNEWGS